ncbi:hypothetical protein INT47_010655 [Mucor saturninus]|uniref:Late embryogenesis abundant protein LEA-2 subgroup domain-containing protein n=1 Tax=Mucor saturninus TaxID=64648 RepID=A0A8H7QLN6_9FUNG|nr:hypothetical protein INT47_010655 [Mucor saturninus]
MPLFSHKNNQVIPAVLHPTVPQRQYLYNEHNRLVPSPPPPPFVEGNRRSFYSVSVPRKFKDMDDVEKYNPQKMLIKEAERANNLHKMSCTRLTCCFCLPCLPMWTRTMCCFIFLVLCGIVGLMTVFVFTFRKPEIVFVGKDRFSTTPGELRFEYNVYNENFFEFNFDSIKAVIYYPTPNKTTIGVAEIHNLVLGPQSVTRVTFPVKMITDTEEGTMSDVGDSVFRQMITSACSDTDTMNGKEIVVVFDLMPTINIYDYPIGTLAFTGQKTKMSCEKNDADDQI